MVKIQISCGHSDSESSWQCGDYIRMHWVHLKWPARLILIGAYTVNAFRFRQRYSQVTHKNIHSLQQKIHKYLQQMSVLHCPFSHTRSQLIPRLLILCQKCVPNIWHPATILPVILGTYLPTKCMSFVSTTLTSLISFDEKIIYVTSMKSKTGLFCDTFNCMTGFFKHKLLELSSPYTVCD